MDDLRALMQRRAEADDDASPTLERTAGRTSAEGLALELAVSAIEALCERGSLTGADVCRLATLLGYDSDAVVRAWHTRAEFDLKKRLYPLDAPIARVLPLF